MEIKQKIVGAIMTIILAGNNLLSLGNIAIAAMPELEKQDSKTTNANVEFNSYLEGNVHEKTYSITETGKMYIQLSVKENGYLKNAVIEITNNNYEIDSNQIESNNVQKIEEQKIYLGQINSKQNVEIEIPISFKKQEKVEKDILDKISEITFRGTYIDGNGNEKNIQKTIYNQIKWEANPEIEINSEITKFIPYQNEEEYGVLVQSKITASILDNSVPVTQTNLEITLPSLKEQKPQRVSSVANTTKATNGLENGTSFGKNNYQYEEKNAKLTINVKNEQDSQGKLNWSEGKDEYLITYIYTGKELYDQVQEQLEQANKTKLTEEELETGKVNENALTGNIILKANMLSINEELITKELAIPYTIEEAKGSITDFGFVSEDTLSKGYIYANYAKQEANQQVKQGENETIYQIGYRAQIYDISLCKEIIFETNSETLTAEKEVSIQNNIITKQVTIEEAIFQKMLGQEGKIEILDKSQNLLGQIDSNTAKDENENYVINIEEHKTNEIIIKTSSPITEGSLEIRIQKAFISNVSYEAKQMQEFTKMTVGASLQTTTDTKDLTKEISLQEPVSKAQISVEGNLSTVIENKDVDIQVVLDTSTIQNALYKNPVIEIQMPTQVKKVEIKDVSIILDEELKIKDKKVIEQNGRQIIQITLEGTQTNYYSNNIDEQQNVIAKGANIIIKTDITLDPLVPSSNEKLQMYYTNENTDLYENTYEVKTKSTVQKIGQTSTDINIVAPTGLVTANSIIGYDATNSELINIEQTKKEATIKTGTAQKTVNVQGIVTNNYNNSLENVVILGRMPAQGNKEIDSNQELGNTFTMELTKQLEISGIDSSKVKIYYSTKEDANKDLNDSSNDWTETPSNIAIVKSYLITIEGEVAANTQLTFNYQVNLPENLGYNNSSYTTYKAYYDNKVEGATIGENQTAGIVGITTGAGPELEVKLTSNVEENTVVRDKQYVRFFVSVKNTGTSAAQDVKVIIDGNKETQTIETDRGTIEVGGTDYYIVDFDEYTNTYTNAEGNKKTIELGNIGIGETKETQYEVQIKYNTPVQANTKVEITNEIEVSCSNTEQTTKSNTYTLEARSTQVMLINKVSALEGNFYNQGMPITYEIFLTNMAQTEDGTLDQVQVNIPLPQGVEVTKANINLTDSTTTEGVEVMSDKVVVTLSNLTRLETKVINITFTIGANTPDFSTKIEAKIGEESYYSNERYIYMSQAKLEGTQLAVDKAYVKEGEKFYYTFNITVEGKGDIVNFVFEDTLADEVFYLPETENGEDGVQVTVLEGENKNIDPQITSNGNTVGVRISLLPTNTKLQIKIYARGKLLNGEEEKEVVNKAKMYAEGMLEVELNSVSHTIEYLPSTTPTDPNNPVNPELPGRYKITGTAWIDENQNGERENTESILPGIQVMLINKSNSEIVLDTQTNKEKIVTTDASGNYEFNNLLPGEYLVVFLYDAAKYSVTEYQKEGVSQSYNSDAISMKIILSGKQTYAGVTDTIKIVNSNGRNIDIGLYVAEKFDLKLDKYISKITLTTPTIGTRVTEYNNTKLTKVEILSKNVNKSSIVVEYKIVVTNEGQISGYVRKIVDYLPEDAKFNTEINQDWYISDNNQTVYNSSLSQTLLNPGESKEVTLVLSFNITDKNMSSIINNNAEIYESYNEQGVEDMDSTPANLIADEDDISQADILLSVVTGAMIALYITLAVIILAIIIASIVIIQKKVLKKK